MSHDDDDDNIDDDHDNVDDDDDDDNSNLFKILSHYIVIQSASFSFELIANLWLHPFNTNTNTHHYH